MSVDQAPATEETLLRDLLCGLGAGGRDARVSLGILGCTRAPNQPPEHCLRACLGGDPNTLHERGCSFLTAAAHHTIDVAKLVDQRCPKGFAVAAQHTAIGEDAAVLFTLEGPLPPAVAPEQAANLLAHLDTAARLVQRIGQLFAENAGFANEVLQNYEQLNLIFDLTQQISRVTDLRDTEALLLRRVAHLLAAETVCIVGTDGECRAYPEPKGTDAAPAIPGGVHVAAVGAIDLVRRTRHVHVAWAGPRQIIAGPLLRLDDKVDVVVAARTAGAPTFSSGDMMLIESVLAFGGQIISNTELHERMRRMSLEVTRALVAAIDKKDHYTSGHSERGGFLTRLTAQELGVPLAEQQTMEWAGLLHDVGKIGIPEEILCKPGKLTPEEFDVVKQHPRMGAEILQPIASLRVVLDGVLYHHEVPNGTGYPEGLAGDEIPLVARIIHVVDTFDALTSTRSYRKAFSVPAALEIIRADQGTRIDTEVATAFMRAFHRYRRENPDDYAARFPHLLGGETDHVPS
jgi:HD-GYP domain-containing protein (c-di-GMP phosphodiesterase class II)